jgi:hypothetical protein
MARTFDLVGPSAIEPNSAPGGLVLRIYGLDGRLISESALRSGESPGSPTALTEAVPRSRKTVALVLYDGDTGERYRLDEAFATGGRASSVPPWKSPSWRDFAKANGERRRRERYRASA